jgi:hypothetical protein
LPQKNRAALKGLLGYCPAKMLLSNYFAGAAGAAVAAASGAAGAAVAAGTAVAAGAGVAAGASTFGVSAGFCSSAFLQPTTAIDREAKKSTLTKMANIFFIKAYPPFTNFPNFWVCHFPNI